MLTEYHFAELTVDDLLQHLYELPRFTYVVRADFYVTEPKPLENEN